MKINLQTRLFPNYNSVDSIKAQQEKKEEAAKKEAEKKAKEELYKDLGKIKSFALGTTPNFVIDLNKDMLQLNDIEQLIVTFGQFGKLVQREILYFSDNYDLDYEVDERGEYIPLSAEVKTDDELIFDDEIQHMDTPFLEYDSEDKKWYRKHIWKHHHQTIRNPKFTYNKVFNTLTLTLSQEDTLRRYKPTNWFQDSDEPYWQGNPSLVMVEVKIRTRRQLDHHMDHQLIIRPQEYYAVAETIEHSLIDEGPVFIKEEHKTGADPIYTPHRFKIFFGDFAKPKDVEYLPQRVEELDHEMKIAQAILVRDGLRVISRPQYEYKNLNSEGAPEPFYRKVEKSRFFCVMIPLFMRVKLKSVKCVFGGSPGIMDRVNQASEGDYPNNYMVPLLDSEGRPVVKDGKVVMVPDPAFLQGIVLPDPTYNPGETCYFQSNYVIDPSGRTPENPMGEYICWYICARDPITDLIGRIYGPAPYMADQEPYYEFLLKFEEIR